MDQPTDRSGADPEPALRFDDHLDELGDGEGELDVAAQLVPRFGYDEAERIMLDAVEDDTNIGEAAQQHLA